MGKAFTARTAWSAPEPALQLGWARLLLFLVPLLAIGLIGDTAMRNRFEERRSAFEDDVASRLERIAVRTDDILALTQPLYELERLRQRSARPLTIEDFSNRLRKTIPGIAFELFVFDGAGTVMGVTPAQVPNQWLMRQLIAGLMADEAHSRRMATDLDRRLKALFGNSRTLDAFRRARGTRIRLQRRQQQVSLFWSADTRGGWLVFITAEPELEMRVRTAWETECGPGAALGWKASDSSRWRILGPARPEFPGRFWRRIERQGRQELDTTSRHWVFRPTNQGHVLFLAVPRPAALVAPPIGIWWGCLLVIACSGGWVALRGRDRLGPISRLSVLLFLIAAGVPTICAAIAGLRVLDDRRELLRGQVRRAQAEALRRFDERFEGFLDRFNRRLISITANPAFYSSLETARKLAAPMTDAVFAGHLELLAPDSRPLLRVPDMETPISAMLPQFQRMGLEILAPGLLATPAIRLDPLTTSLMRGAQFGFTALALRPRRINQMNAGSNRPILFWDYPRAGAPPVGYASLVFRRERLMSWYVANNILDSGSLWGAKIRFAAHHIEQSEAFPARSPLWNSLMPALHRSRVLNKPVSGMVRSGMRDWWYTAMVGSNLDRYGLIALFPDAKIEESLGELRHRAFAGMAVMLALAAGLGIFLSRSLTRPVTALADGVERLQRKEFNRPVRIAGQDELARLSAAFNEMMAELKDLDVARAVQTSLLPSSYPRVSGYAIQGKSLFAGDLGGDCLDCRTLPGGRILLLTGDVSGHGAASALLMAFVKATITLWSGEGAATPARLAERIDGLLRSFPGPRRFLSLFAGVLDPETHILRYLSCGHPYPLLITADGSACHIGTPAYPLGIRRHPNVATVQELRFEPGATLLLYTDGLVEAVDASGAQIGYDRLSHLAAEACLAAAGGESRANAVLAGLLERHAALAARIEDDLTVMAVSRLSGKRGPA
ncbi:MAG TPA: SpoIIE family protein phosphatase [Candidatus Ozemobacteraceae bacterium]